MAKAKAALAGTPPAKKSKKAAAAAAVEDAENQAHGLIDLAKAGEWEALYKALDSCGSLVNYRPDVREYAVIHQAAFLGSAAVSTLIDNYGADPGLRTKTGQSVYEIAVACGHTSIAAAVSLRLDGSARELTPEKMRGGKRCAVLGAPALTEAVLKRAHEAVSLARDAKWKEVFAMLDNAPSLVNVRPSVRDFPILHQAAYHGDAVAVVALLEKYGADVSQLSKGGQLAADVAQKNGHSELAKQLRARSPSVNGEAEIADECEADVDIDFVQMPDGSWKVSAKPGSGTSLAPENGAPCEVTATADVDHAQAEKNEKLPLETTKLGTLGRFFAKR